MYPLTHVYFSQMLLGRVSDAATLGSLFPDMAIGSKLNHTQAHSLGLVMQKLLQSDQELADFARGVISHGMMPRGLDYFGDEKYPGCERGYCFEKGRPLVDDTIVACNLPPRMGWWKAHNIIEMGIEIKIGAGEDYGQLIHRAFRNKELIARLGPILASLTGYSEHWLQSRIDGFANYIEIFATTPEALARRYRIQMQARHQIEINVPQVAGLIERAMDLVKIDLEQFFLFTRDQVARELREAEQKALIP